MLTVNRCSPMMGFHALVIALLQGLALGQLFFNPMLPGFHPDPSCIFHREDETFYCATSSFNSFPGIPIHASKDLTSWRLVGHALNREEQLPELAISNGSTSGIWAPALRHHNGTFYLVTTLVHDKKAPEDPKRWDNIIFSTPDILDDSKWSKAVHFDFEGYDTEPFWESGESYIVGSHAYRVQPGIHINKIDLQTGQLKSNWTNLWNGTGGLAPEGPHLYKKDGYYYLMLAEGGTGLEHMVTIARSKSLYGPYDPNPNNPILSNANTTEYFQTVGHADLFQDPSGKWWGVALSTRSGPEYITYPMGRETVLSNVVWENGSWPKWNQIRGQMNGWTLPELAEAPGNGQLVAQNDENLTFAPGSKLPLHFTYWRPPIASNYVISPPSHPNTLALKPSKLNLTGLDGNAGGPGRQTFVSRRQSHTFFTYTVDMEFDPVTRDEEAGISLFLTQNHHARFGVAMLPLADNSSNTPTLAPHFRFHAISYIRVPPDSTVPVPQSWRGKKLTFELKTVNITHYTFSAGPADESEDMRIFAYVPGDIVSWGFTGTLVGVYATSNGGNGSTQAYVSNWNYLGEGQQRDNPIPEDEDSY